MKAILSHNNIAQEYIRIGRRDTSLRRWIMILVLLILGVGFAVTMDLLLGFKLRTSIYSILQPFRFMFKAEYVIIVLTILYVATLEVKDAFQKK